MARLRGRLVKWDDDRGFGFIEADGSRDQVFVHIKAIGEIATRPRLGDRVSYEVGRGREGRPAAERVVIEGANPRDRLAERRGEPQPSYPARDQYRVYAAIGVGVLATAVAVLRLAPEWVPAAYAGMGFFSFVSYWVDKRFAETDQWRVPERTLHVADLAGGIIGGLLGQQIFRHKTSKPNFAFVSYGIAAVHALGLGALLTGLFPA